MTCIILLQIEKNMAIKDDFVPNIRRNEIRIRKKEKKTKGYFFNY